MSALRFTSSAEPRAGAPRAVGLKVEPIPEDRRGGLFASNPNTWRAEYGVLIDGEVYTCWAGATSPLMAVTRALEHGMYFLLDEDQRWECNR